MRFSPFRPLRPTPAIAASLLSPPYDVVSLAEARHWAKNQPASFLRITRAELELADDASPYAPEIYLHARANLAAFLEKEWLAREAAPVYGAYRLTRGDWRQTGLVGLASVAEYRAGTVKRHELTRAEKEDDRTRHISVTGAQTGPVFLACRDAGPSGRAGAELGQALARVTATEPALDITTPDGVRHEAWLIRDIAAFEAITTAIDALYICDGHHRAASAARVADERDQRDAGPASGILSVVFPASELRILPYHRVVADLGGHTPEAFLAELAESFDIGPPGADPDQVPHRTFAMYLEGAWRLLAPKPALVDETDPIAALDVAILQDHLLAPILGIRDPRRDARIDFVGGIRGTAELAARVDAFAKSATRLPTPSDALAKSATRLPTPSDALAKSATRLPTPSAAGQGVAFAMHATSLGELFRAADAGLVMPPKSTWFEPKLADGLFVHVVED